MKNNKDSKKWDEAGLQEEAKKIMEQQEKLELIKKEVYRKLENDELFSNVVMGAAVAFWEFIQEDIVKKKLKLSKVVVVSLIGAVVVDYEKQKQSKDGGYDDFEKDMIESYQQGYEDGREDLLKQIREIEIKKVKKNGKIK